MARAKRPSPVFELLDRLEVDVDVGAVLQWSDGTEEVVRVDHRAHDGLSAAAVLLQSAGYEARPPRRRPVAPGDVRWREWFGIWRRFRTDFRDRQVVWREQHPVDGKVPPLQPSDPGFGYVAWDEPTSRAILEWCAARRVSVNALMLWGLLQAVRPLVADGTASFPWIMPVDLRRRGRADEADTVATSGVMLDIGADDRPEDVQAQLERKLDEKTYLAYWWITEKLPTLLPKAVLWPILRSKELGGNRCMGGCTHLGDLSSWVAAAPPDRTVVTPIGFNLLSRQFPVQSVGIQWDGRLVFSLRLHPMVWAGPVAPFVETWQRTVEDEVGVHARPGS